MTPSLTGESLATTQAANTAGLFGRRGKDGIPGLSSCGTRLTGPNMVEDVDTETLLKELHELELRIVGMLREAGKLILDASSADKTEDRRQLVLRTRTYAQTVQELHTAIHSLVDRIPRRDFPRRNDALLRRYRQFLMEE